VSRPVQAAGVAFFSNMGGVRPKTGGRNLMREWSQFPKPPASYSSPRKSRAMVPFRLCGARTSLRQTIFLERYLESFDASSNGEPYNHIVYVNGFAGPWAEC